LIQLLDESEYVISSINAYIQKNNTPKYDSHRQIFLISLVNLYW
jgi:hypothetical protein